MTKNPYPISLFLIMAAAIIQYFAGNFPFHFFEFPLNIILGIIWIYSIYILLRGNNSKGNISRILVSPKTTAFSLFMFVCGTLIIGLFPQLSAIDAENKEGILGRLGFYNFMSSWIFVSVLFILLSHLAAITIKGFRTRKNKRWRFLLNHAGVWLALFGGFMGSSDIITARIPVFFDKENNEALTMEGKHFYLDYDMQLTDFDADYYQNGIPKSYVANVKISDRQSGESSLISLEVNHPYEYKFGEDIYLVSYDTRSIKPQYCILQIVRQPWKYVQLIGIIMTIAGAVGMFIGGPQKQS
ncbi:cytochrome c biogenesis protein ResB [Bacteroides caecigallinarum]|uniref:cytochrome c biogenesis protein ResB n=1 Tax=Bacteroides caecigallinarum TaxID=1411144 RepID=UPI001F206EF4|nr:cytochrome c biogenesis protein ResB [Bacteroides caecigallinarum]MCF2550853.1 cytochrome c biogenesis protein ResB [Bacteroides caecigallinarum]MDN0052046.1 cytochrome c biogenesis protein ResB [Bacteroides caecigallinarum]